MSTPSGSLHDARRREALFLSRMCDARAIAGGATRELRASRQVSRSAASARLSENTSPLESLIESSKLRQCGTSGATSATRFRWGVAGPMRHHPKWGATLKDHQKGDLHMLDQRARPMHIAAAGAPVSILVVHVCCVASM
eukprot:scaffold146216_cov31-Tisochrysis_lutea.AAC.1